MELLNDQLGVLKHANVDSLLTVADCESMEAKLKQSLSAIEKKKVCHFYVRLSDDYLLAESTDGTRNGKAQRKPPVRHMSGNKTCANCGNIF